MRAPDLGRWRRRRERADALAEAGQLEGEIRDRLGRLHALTLVQQQWPGFTDQLVDLARLAYVDGLVDGAAEDADGLVGGRDRAERTADCAVAIRAASGGFVLALSGGAVRIFETNDELWSQLVAVLDGAGVGVDDGLAALGSPGLAALFTDHQSHAQEDR